MYAAGNLFADTSNDPCYIQAGSTWDDDGYNAAASGAQCLGAPTDVADPALPGDLGTLAANGGGTETVLPDSGAPEIGAVPDPTSLSVDGSPVPLCPVTDQTGALSNDEDCSIGSLFVASLPGAPTGLSATGVSGGASLSWTAPVTNGGATVTGYDIYQGTTPGGESSVPVNGAPVGATSYTVSGLTGHGPPYYFVVSAVDGSGKVRTLERGRRGTQRVLPGPDDNFRDYRPNRAGPRNNDHQGDDDHDAETHRDNGPPSGQEVHHDDDTRGPVCTHDQGRHLPHDRASVVDNRVIDNGAGNGHHHHATLGQHSAARHE